MRTLIMQSMITNSCKKSRDMHVREIFLNCCPWCEVKNLSREAPNIQNLKYIIWRHSADNQVTVVQQSPWLVFIETSSYQTRRISKVNNALIRLKNSDQNRDDSYFGLAVFSVHARPFLSLDIAVCALRWISSLPTCPITHAGLL